MSSLLTAHPKSFEDITEAFRNWRPHSRRPRIEFLRRKSENVLILRSKPDNNVRLEVEGSKLLCELAGSKLHLYLYEFDIATKFEKGYILCEFKRSHASGALKESLSAVENTKYPIFITRALNALTGLEQKMPKERIEEASAASTDYQVLLSAITEPSVAAQLAVNDPLAAAKIRGVEQQQSMLKQFGGVLTVGEVEKILGISRQAIHKRQKQGQLIGLTLGKRGYAYPAWQFEKGVTLPNLEPTLHALRGHDPWMQMAFFVNGNYRLDGKSPLELLRAGRLEPVLRAAESYGEQGAA